MHVYIYFCYICGRRSGGTILLGITLLVTLCFSWPLHFALSVRSMFAALLAFNSPYLYILCLHFLCLPFHRPCSLSIASSLSLSLSTAAAAAGHNSPTWFLQRPTTASAYILVSSFIGSLLVRSLVHSFVHRITQSRSLAKAAAAIRFRTRFAT